MHQCCFSSEIFFILILFQFVSNHFRFVYSVLVHDLTRGVQQQRKPRDAAVKYYPYSTFITLGPTKGSGKEDKSFAEKSGN